MLHPDEGCFCAIGVILETYRKDTGLGKWPKYNGYVFLPEYSPACSTMPPEVSYWLGISHCSINYTKVMKIVDLNDNECWPFPKIADYLEKTLLP